MGSVTQEALDGADEDLRDAIEELRSEPIPCSTYHDVRTHARAVIALHRRHETELAAQLEVVTRERDIAVHRRTLAERERDRAKGLQADAENDRDDAIDERDAAVLEAAQLRVDLDRSRRRADAMSQLLAPAALEIGLLIEHLENGARGNYDVSTARQIIDRINRLSKVAP